MLRGRSSAAPAAGQFLRVTISSPQISLLGAAISATSISLEAVIGAETTVTMSATGLSLTFSDGGATPLIGVTVASAQLTVTSTGVLATITGGVLTENISGVDLGGTIGVRIDTRNPANRYVRITIDNGTVAFGSGNVFSLGGSFTFEQVQVSPSRTVVKVAASGVTATIGSVVNVTNGSGILLVSEVGLAGSFSATASITMPAGIDIVATTFRIDVNTSGAAVTESLVVNGDTISMALPAGPFLQVAVIGAKLFIGDEPSITADLFFRSAGASVFFGVKNFAVTVDGNVVGGGEGAFVVLSNGIAGIASGSVSLSGGGVSAGASGTLRVNTTGAQVTQSFTFDGQTFALDIPGTAGGTFFDLAITGASLNIGGFVTIEIGSGSFTGGVLAGVRVFLGQGPAFFPDGTSNSAARGVLLTNAFG